MSDAAEQVAEAMNQTVEGLKADTEELNRNLMMGMRLSTAAQILQGMLASGEHKLGQPTIDSAVKWADVLIEKCQ